MAISVTVKVTNRLKPKTDRIKRKLALIPRRAYREWLKNTPVRTGNARRSTRFRRKDTIEAQYPYAQRLDQGYSKQSPEGMSKPVGEFIQREVNRIMRGK